MGIQSSTNILRVNNDLTTKAFNACPKVTASNEAEVRRVVHRPNSLCVNPTFEFNQKAGVYAECLINNVQDSLAETIAKMDAETQGGLGFQFSQNVADIKNQITQIAENKCKGLSATNKAKLEDIDTTACNFQFVQDATVKSACTINNMQKLANQVAVDQYAKATGWLSLGNLGALVAIILVVVIGGWLISSSTGKKKDDETKKGGGLSWNSMCEHLNTYKIYYILIFVILILIIIFIAYSKKPTKQITKKDMMNLGKSIKEAHQIAGIEPYYHVYFSPASDMTSSSDSSVINECYDNEPLYEMSVESDQKLEDFYQPLI